jgi:hypothetical protein
MMTVLTDTEQSNSVDLKYDETNDTVACVFSNTLHSFVKFYRNNISLQERRQLTVAASKGRLDYKTSSVIREQEEEMLNVLELPVSW